MKMIRVIAKTDGFRRGGRSWSGTTIVPASDFTKEQLAQLLAEKRDLVVEEFDQPETDAKPEDGDSKTKPASAKK